MEENGEEKDVGNHISTFPSRDEPQKFKPSETTKDNINEYDMSETVKDLENWNGLNENSIYNELISLEVSSPDELPHSPIDFNSLPHVVVLHILSFLGIKDLGHIACVSKYLNSCCQYPGLWQHVNISNRRLVTDDVLQHVLIISKNITSLDISESRNITEHGLQTALLNCQSLRELKAVRCECITDTCLEVIGQFCMDLRMVDFSMCKITDLGIEKFSFGCTKLQQVKLDHCRQLTSTTLIHIANNCPGLQWLSVENDIEIHDDGVDELVTTCSTLKRLQLNSCGITGQAIRSIAMHGHALTVLDVRYCTTLNDELVKELVFGCPDLVILNLSLCFNVTDLSAVYISQYCTNLKSIYLVNCRITDQGMKTFSCSTFGLEWIDVSWCQDITDEGVRTLVHGCKTLKHLAESIKCYVCANYDGNCNTGETECPSTSILTYDTCMKATTGNAVAKTCSTSGLCSAAKDACKSSGNCEAFCCQGDLCNASVTLKPMLVVTALASLVAVAQYFM